MSKVNGKVMWKSILFLSFVSPMIKGGELLEVPAQIPAVVTTWKFTNATAKAWDVLFEKEGTALDAIEAGCKVCEDEQCDFTVGFGGSPDENGETTLDAMMMDGATMKVGSVGGLRDIKNAIGVARKVLDHTQHSLLVGNLASDFALEMGFFPENLTTADSKEVYEKWRENDCQPNFWQSVQPDPTSSCGPYKPVRPFTGSQDGSRRQFSFGEKNHDTIGMIAIDSKNHIASGTSTNGAKHKVPGRVGDSPIAGAGSYADDDVGAAAGTGDGDVAMRFLPTFLAVEEMRRGRSPEKAAQAAIDRIVAKYPSFRGGIIALRKDGLFGAACAGFQMLPYCVASPLTGGVKVFYKLCSQP